MSSAYKYKISVLIITYNNASTISDCLESIKSQGMGDYEILVMDNSSEDLTLEQIKKYDDIKVFHSKENTGFAAGMNYLSKQADGEYLFMLNPDCICPNNTLETLYEFAQDHKGVISPALIYPDNTPQPSARQLISYKNVLFSRRSPLYQMGFAKTGNAGYLILEKTARVPAVSATALFLHGKLFAQIGGFDERFFLYLEDIDLCKRLNEINADVWYLPELKITHILGTSSSCASIKTSYYHHLSMYKYFTKHFPGNYIKNVLLLLLLAAGFTASVILKFLKPKRRK